MWEHIKSTQHWYMYNRHKYTTEYHYVVQIDTPIVDCIHKLYVCAITIYVIYSIDYIDVYLPYITFDAFKTRKWI